jgi:bifunctional DNA-binding transcriptional regulator/antitoxin component of YhaV-PrlF toxin-antitoxin module
MEITKLSSKGQVVIPEVFRKGFSEGTAFNVVKKNDLIVLKPISSLSSEEVNELKGLDKVWKKIDSGNCTKMKFDDFMDEIKKW